jgi:two-component system, OmpR family, alkaline phosphatase synthesis response regulator PhoP
LAGKILIADDEAYIRLLIEQTFEEIEDQGVHILNASNGLDAMEKFQLENPDLVFLDVMMPGMNGYDVCQQMKANNPGNAYIVLLTAKGQEYDRTRGKEAGADLYITKPFDPDELLELAHKIFG